jgi:hypothetical protein
MATNYSIMFVFLPRTCEIWENSSCIYQLMDVGILLHLNRFLAIDALKKSPALIICKNGYHQKNPLLLENSLTLLEYIHRKLKISMNKNENSGLNINNGAPQIKIIKENNKKGFIKAQVS